MERAGVVEQAALSKIFRHMAAIKEGKSYLIVAPSHAECRSIAAVVRDLGKKAGFLSPEEHIVRKLEKLNLTESQRRDAIDYNVGQVVEFCVSRYGSSSALSAGWRGNVQKVSSGN